MNTIQHTDRQYELDEIVKEELLLTTADNPFNPHTQWRQWYAFDVQHGYNTCAYLARIVSSSHELSEADQALAINQALSEIVSVNLTGNYLVVTKTNFDEKIKRIRDLDTIT